MRVLRPLARIWTVFLGCTAMALTLGLAARMLLPLSPWAEAPALVAVAPADGAAAVLPRSAIELRFSQPMNRRSTLAALSITPPTPGDLDWSDDGRTLTFQPRPALSADATYTVRLDGGALGRWWRPLAEPRAVAFRTAPLPAVIAALPDGVAPPDTSVAIIFSQPMVPPERVGSPAELPELSFEPPIAASLRWSDPSTLLIRPAAALRAAARYTATISADLTDARGVELGEPFTWSFSTAWPAVLSQSPPPGERWVSPRAPLTLSLDAPVDPALLREALTISPDTEGDLAAAVVDSTQLITFTPGLGWQPGQSYTVALVAPPGRGLSAPPPLRWRFSVAPPPGLLAFFPGQSQTLPPGQAIRLIFSTPMDEAALRAGLSIDPPVDELPISVSETEVRLRPELRPSTVYTVTLAAGTPDRNGEPIADGATLTIRTGPAAPALRAAAPGGIVTLPLSTTAVVELERVNLARLDLALYRLDTPALLRALDSGPAGLRDFRPERYGQARARSWQVDLDDPADAPARDALPVALTDGAPLDPGAYYLRVLSPEGPRADLILLVSSVHLAMRQSDSQVLVWATDVASGAPLAGVPVALYAGDAPVTRGVTGADGVWEQPIQRGPQDPPPLAVAEGAEPAVVNGAWASSSLPAEPRTRALLLLDAPAYEPGAVARVAGQARRAAADGSLALPAPATPCRLQLIADGGPRPLPPLSAECRVARDGDVSGSLRLDPGLAPGAYSLRAQVGDQATLLPLRVAGPGGLAELSVERVGQAEISLRASAAELPLSNTVVSWSLRLEPLALPALAEGFRFPAPRSVEELSGSASTDDAGRVRISLPEPAAGGPPRRFRLRAELRGPDGAPAAAEAIGIASPPGPSVGVRMAAQAIASDERATVELLALGTGGQPERGVELVVEVFRGAEPAGGPLLERRARSDAEGRASAQLVQLNPGRYSVVARAGDAESRVDLWVAGPGYTGWENEPGRVAVIPDRDAYRPGDTARLLVTAPAAESNLLLTVERGGLLSRELRRLRAGQLITLTVSPDLAPAFGVGALLAADGARLSGETSLRVIGATAPLTVSVATDRDSYLPGATATISITVDEAGAPAPADLLLALAPDAALPAALTAADVGFAPGRPVQLAAAVGPPTGPVVTASQAVPRLAPPGYLVPISGGAGATGLTVTQARVPELPGRWRVVAYAFSGAGRLAIGSAAISTTLPLELLPRTPPVLRPGDEAAAELVLRNSSPLTRTLRATLTPAGPALADGQPAAQQVLLAPGGAQVVGWRLRGASEPGPGALTFRVQGDEINEELTREVLILPAPEAAARAGNTWAGSGDLAVVAAAPGGALALAPTVRAALADAAEGLAVASGRDVEQSAALLLIAAGLSREGPPSERDRWRDLAALAAAELDEAQNADGGWGWWPGAPSDPFVSAFALEAQGAGRASGVAAGASLRAVSFLQRSAAGAAPALRAYSLYALARAGHADAAGAAELLADDLDPDSVAFLALSLPAAQGAPALAGLAAPGGAGGLLWQATGEAPLPRTPLAVSAAVAQALRALQPDSPALAASGRGLRLAWGVGGWPSPYEAARVAAALLPIGAQSAGPRRLLVDDRPLVSAPITSTVHLQLPGDGGGEGARIAVEAPEGSDYLLAYRAPSPAPEDAPGRPPLEVRFLDAERGVPIDPASLQVGQTVILEVTLISPRPLLRAELAVELPAALEPVAAEGPAPFMRASVDGPARRATLDAAGLPAGVYAVRVVTRVVAEGEYGAEAPRLRDRFDPAAATRAGEPLEVRVTR